MTKLLHVKYRTGKSGFRHCVSLKKKENYLTNVLLLHLLYSTVLYLPTVPTYLTDQNLAQTQNVAGNSTEPYATGTYLLVQYVEVWDQTATGT